MILFTNGCSFTYGDELSNSKEQSFPKLLSNNLSCDKFLNYAGNGSSNDKILRTALDVFKACITKTSTETKIIK